MNRMIKTGLIIIVLAATGYFWGHTYLKNHLGEQVMVVFGHKDTTIEAAVMAKRAGEVLLIVGAVILVVGLVIGNNPAKDKPQKSRVSSSTLCQNCGSIVEAESNFCDSCGASTEIFSNKYITCSSCNEKVEKGAYCENCGEKFSL